mmetsp:Transcript_17686/g.31802  ORF Transcript_17686/g.31802 Transcript_17686/m.31802 type:complete len:470 (+) Transcript_17686:4626-6035(+)
MNANFKRRWRIIAMIVVLNTFIQMERFLISFITANSSLLEDTDTSKTEYGVLSGTSYFLTCAVFLLPFGRWADKLKKTRWPVTIFTVTLNFANLANGFAVNFWTLLVPRVVCAFCSVGSDSIFIRMIALYFPPGQRGYATGFYLFSNYIGNSLIFLLRPVLGAIGWRHTYFLLGGTGLVFSLVIGLFLWTEYEFMEEDYEAATRLKENKLCADFWHLLRTNRTLSLTMVAFSMRTAAGYVRSFFDTIYFNAQFPSKKDDYSYITFGATIFTASGPVIGGYLSDCAEKYSKKWRPFLCSLASFLAVGLYVLMYNTENFPVAMVCVYLTNFFGSFYRAVVGAMNLNTSPSHMRAFVSGWVNSIALTLSALTLALVGVFAESHEVLRDVYVYYINAGVLLASVIFLIEMWTYPRDLLLMTSRKNSEITHELLSEEQSMDQSNKDSKKTKETKAHDTELQASDPSINGISKDF